MELAGDSKTWNLSGDRSGDLSGDFSGDFSGDKRGCRVGDRPARERRSFKGSVLVNEMFPVNGVEGDKLMPDVVRARGVVCGDDAAEI